MRHYTLTGSRVQETDVPAAKFIFSEWMGQHQLQHELEESACVCVHSPVPAHAMARGARFACTLENILLWHAASWAWARFAVRHQGCIPPLCISYAAR